MAISEPSKRLILEAATGEYQYDPRPLVQTPVMIEGWYRIFSNPNPPTRTQPIVFDVKGDAYRYIDLNSSFFEFKLRLTAAAAADIAADPKIGPINLIGQTLWKSVRKQINGEYVSPNDNMYA